MNKKDLEYFKKKLEQEKKLLEEELNTVGRVNPSNPGGWSAVATEDETDNADENVVADKMEELEGNSAIMTQLEKQLKDVTDALGRIDGGTYGVCEVSGEQIERERLEANPAARTSVKHMRG
jgi:RNA polymerase-binding transcription factor DksA